jgi:hypothetical protein
MIKVINSESSETIPHEKEKNTKIRKKRFSVYPILFIIIGIIFLFKLYSEEDKIEPQFLRKGVPTYFDFGQKLGTGKGLIFIAEEDDVIFSIITTDGDKGISGKDNLNYILRPDQTGVYVVSKNKDTNMNIFYKKSK